MTDLRQGLTGAAEWTVTEAMTASHLGSGLVPVFSTPMLVALMENAAVNALESHIEPEQTSVGTRIDVEHLAATPVGVVVRAQAALIAVEDRKLTFAIEAWDNVELIGRATHERFLVNRARFEAKAAQKR